MKLEFVDAISVVYELENRLYMRNRSKSIKLKGNSKREDGLNLMQKRTKYMNSKFYTIIRK